MRSLTWDQMALCSATSWLFDDRGLALNDDPEPEVKREIIFLGTQEKGIKFMPQTSSATVKVKVNGNYRVVHDRPYIGGDVFDAPDDEQTKRWIQAGWVTPVPATKKEKV